MFESCDVCGLRFADVTSVKVHAEKVHRHHYNTSIAAVLPAMGDGSTGLKGARLVLPTKITSKSSEQIAAELEDRLGIHNFYGYTIYPLETVPAKPRVVKVKPTKLEHSYAEFYKKLGSFVVDKKSNAVVA